LVSQEKINYEADFKRNLRQQQRKILHNVRVRIAETDVVLPNRRKCLFNEEFRRKTAQKARRDVLKDYKLIEIYPFVDGSENERHIF
jgi:hypothetical protein